MGSRWRRKERGAGGNRLGDSSWRCCLWRCSCRRWRYGGFFFFYLLLLPVYSFFVLLSFSLCSTLCCWRCSSLWQWYFCRWRCYWWLGRMTVALLPTMKREVIVILLCSFVFLVFSSIFSSTPTLLCLLVPLVLVLAKDGGLEWQRLSKISLVLVVLSLSLFFFFSPLLYIMFFFFLSFPPSNLSFAFPLS